MKKVVYTVRKSRSDSYKLSGIGFITEQDLIASGISSNNKSYVRIFEEAVNYCHAVDSQKTEFKGILTEYPTVNIDTGKGNYEEKQVTIDYYIWYKIIN